MVNFGVPLSSTTFSRVSSALPGNVVLGNLRRNHEIMLRIQEQLSSGMAINRPSDNPIGANRVLGFNSQIARNDQFLLNLETAHSRLAFSEQAMLTAEEVINRARETYLAERNSPSDASTRLLAAQEIDLLIKDLMGQVNTRVEGRHLFGGSRTAGAPFVSVGPDVAFKGDLQSLNIEVADRLLTASNVTASAFGALSDEIRGLDPTTFLAIDLNPAVTGNTRLADLNGGRGVAVGSVRITGSIGTADVDLRAAKSVSDVIDLINDEAATTGVTASLKVAGDPLGGASGLRLTDGGGPITVADIQNGTTARDLGLLPSQSTSVAPDLFSADLDPILTGATLLGDLFGGTGVDSSGIVITNQSPHQTLTETFDSTVFSATSTVEQLINAINASSTETHAGINDEATGLNVQSRLSGAFLSISENGGTTAASLGLLTTLARTRLADLHNGNGIGTDGGDDLRITKKDGTVASFDVDTAVTVNDLVTLLDSDADLSVVITGTNEIEITDLTGGAGNLIVSNIGPSFAATNLGIEGSTAGATLTGTPLTPVGAQVEGLFTALLRLRNALESNDVNGMDSASKVLDASEERVLGGRGEIGARLASLELTRNRIEFDRVELQKLRSQTRDADIAELATQFSVQQTVLQASLATASRILETTLFDFL